MIERRLWLPFDHFHHGRSRCERKLMWRLYAVRSPGPAKLLSARGTAYFTTAALKYINISLYIDPYVWSHLYFKLERGAPMRFRSLHPLCHAPTKVLTLFVRRCSRSQVTMVDPRPDTTPFPLSPSLTHTNVVPTERVSLRGKESAKSAKVRPSGMMLPGSW